MDFYNPLSAIEKLLKEVFPVSEDEEEAIKLATNFAALLATERIIRNFQAKLKEAITEHIVESFARPHYELKEFLRERHSNQQIEIHQPNCH